jgi:beta-glucosidase/6-phospho-beta-glucosidase/beta-galactosidase
MKEVTKGYADGTYAPGIKQPGTAPYTVAHNLVRAHARAYHVYKNEFKNKQKGNYDTCLIKKNCPTVETDNSCQTTCFQYQ